jgi:hypothetical protein
MQDEFSIYVGLGLVSTEYNYIGRSQPIKTVAPYSRCDPSANVNLVSAEPHEGSHVYFCLWLCAQEQYKLACQVHVVF